MEFNQLGMFFDEKTADRAAVEFNDLMRAGSDGLLEVAALPGLVPRSVRGFDVRTERALEQVVEKLTICFASWSPRDLGSHVHVV